MMVSDHADADASNSLTIERRIACACFLTASKCSVCVAYEGCGAVNEARKVVASGDSGSE